MANLVKVGRVSEPTEARGHKQGEQPVTALPTKPQRNYLRRGLDQPGGKLPLFDENGAAFNQRTIRACIENGWAEPWFSNPQKPDWQVCKLTELGVAVLGGAAVETKAGISGADRAK
jgi:hypothetical protein